MFNLKYVLIVVSVVLIALLLNYSYKVYSYSNEDTSFIGQLSQKEKKPLVIISDKNISVEVARTSAEKDLGLGGRNSLGKDEGMLFVFDFPNIPSFWMKGMLIPLDIIWISDDTVTYIHKDIKAPKTGTPLSNLPKFSPQEPVIYALEVNAGFSDKNKIKIGDEVIIKL